MRPATGHRTAERRCTVPTPVMAPVTTWVVDTGAPRIVEPTRAAPAAVSAANPLIGLRSVRRPPSVRTMRQPPDSVPSAIAEWAKSTTHNGTGSAPEFPPWR